MNANFCSQVRVTSALAAVFWAILVLQRRENGLNEERRCSAAVVLVLPTCLPTGVLPTSAPAVAIIPIDAGSPTCTPLMTPR